MKAIYGVYDSAEGAQRGFDGLRAAGLARREILVLSSEPHEEFEFGRQDNKTAMPWIAAGGAALGLAAAYLLTSLTQQDLPLVTGGMPIVTGMTNLIILFELTMLGAVMATVATLVRSAGFFKRVPEYYEPEVSEGRIVIGVVQPDAMKVTVIERALRSSSPQSLRTR
jgi:hypothetical protein